MEVKELMVGKTKYYVGQEVEHEGVTKEIQFLYDNGSAQIRYNGRVRMVPVSHLGTYDQSER